jgi:formate dehydrogenase major subunit
VVHYTNAPFLVNPDFKGPGELGGVFSGYNEKTREYDMKTWSFQLDENGLPKKDLTLENPHCVFQLLRKHYSRYSIDMVSTITGTPKEKLEEVYKAFTVTGKRDMAGTILYSMGTTQHSVGSQNVRSKAIIQLLLGNMGMAGGGVNALRGECSAQGSPDNGILSEVYPGYMPVPSASLVDLEAYVAKHAPACKDPKSINWWINRDKYIVSYLKSLFGDKATKDNDFAYSWLAKFDEGMNITAFAAFEEMHKGNVEGFFAWAYNPACSASNANKIRKAMSKLQWMVCVDIFDTETASFWRGPGMKPEEINTEVFLLPAATHFEKEGSTTSTARVLQWKYKAVEPMGESMADYDIMNKLYFRVRRLYLQGGVFPEPVINLMWNYGEKWPDGEIKSVDVHSIAKDINGFYLEDIYDMSTNPPVLIGKKGDQVPSFTFLQADGTTSCGNWLYCGSYPQVDGKPVNMAQRRDRSDPTGLGLFSKWGWSWPANRRILYNRASVDLEGKPWDPGRAVLRWNPTDGSWEGDIPDGSGPPVAHEDGKYPFVMKIDGVGHIFGPLADGPFPEHYEPMESPVIANPMSKQRINPVAKLDYMDKDELPVDLSVGGNMLYPIVATTIRTQELYETGSSTRRQPGLLEMMPQMFVEMSEELAQEKNIQNGDKVIVSSARGKLWAKALVTKRFKPFKVAGSTVHQVGMPWCFGWRCRKMEVEGFLKFTGAVVL